MNLAEASHLSTTEDSYFKDIYTFISKSGRNSSIAGDAGLVLYSTQV